MKSLSVLAVLFLYSASELVRAQDDACRNDFQSFLTCAKNQISDSERQGIKDDTQSKTTACFTQAGCTPPSSNAQKNPMGQMNMPDSVKRCIKLKLIQKIGVKLNDCLSRHNVRNVNFTQIADSMEGSGFETGISGNGHGGAGGGEMQQAMMAKFAAVKGVDKCCGDKFGGDTNKMKPLEQCLQDIKKPIKERVCKDLQPCENSLSGNCKQRTRDVRRALCQCKKEKEREIAGKLAQLGQQDKVPIQTLIKTVADDQDMSDVMNTVDQCYHENNEQEPPMLQLAIKMMSNQGGQGNGGAQNARFGAMMTVTGRQCTIMSDMLNIDADDQSECDSCQ